MISFDVQCDAIKCTPGLLSFQQLVDVQILPAYLNNLKVNILTADLIINSTSQKYQ